LRVIAGRFRSRRLKSVSGDAVRPTPDRLRESLFSILTARILGATFLDAYAGTGAVGIEALSRGAQHVIFIERSAAALAILHANLRSLDIATEVTVLRGSAAALISQHPTEIVFLDPPYDQPREYAACLAAARCELAIAQHSSRLALDERYGSLLRTRVLKQGDNSLSFYERAAISM
jgi:16S rRNA (guanine966-N2)-methyltransferase